MERRQNKKRLPAVFSGDVEYLLNVFSEKKSHVIFPNDFPAPAVRMSSVSQVKSPVPNIDRCQARQQFQI